MEETIKRADLYSSALQKTVGEIELEYWNGEYLIRLTPCDELFDEVGFECETISKDDLAFLVHSFGIEIQPYGYISDNNILMLIKDIEYYIDNEMGDSERENGIVFRESLSESLSE